MNMTSRLCLALLPLLAGLGGCGNTDQPTPSGRPPGMSAPVQVIIAPVVLAQLSDKIEAIGTIRALESVTLTPKVSDIVSAVHFEDGDLAAAGAVLVELTNREERALLAEAQANLTDARRQLRRMEDLGQQGSVPRSQVDEARTRVEAQEARLEALLARLDDRLIRAPFAGLLGFRQISTGTLATPGTTITTIDDISQVRLDFSIPEVYLGALAPGQQVRAQSVAFPGQTFAGTITSIGSRVDPVSRAATVRALIPNSDMLLRPGMLMTLTLITAEREAPVVPERALTQLDTRTFVFVSNQGVAEQREVRTGLRQNRMVEITQGLEVGELVVTEGIIRVRPGMRIQSGGSAHVAF